MSRSDPLRIRRMRAEDVPVLAGAFADMNKTLTQYELYWRENVEGRRVTLVALLGRSVVGYTNVIWESDYEPFSREGIPEINDMNTVSGYRRRGIGTQMIAAAEQVAVEAGKSIMGIGVGATPDYAIAQSLYPKLGYEADGTGVHEDSWGGCIYSTKRLGTGTIMSFRGGTPP